MLWRLIRRLLRPGDPPRQTADRMPRSGGVTDAPNPWLQRGGELVRTGRLDAAIEAYRAGIAEHPHDPYLHAALANTLNAAWRNDECIEACVQAVNATGGRPEVFSGLLMFCHYASRPDPPAIFELHRQYGERMAAAVTPCARRDRACDPERRLRLGYVSRDLRLHSITDFLEPVLARHDRNAFEVHCYFTQRYADEVTARLKRLSDVWHDVPEREPDALAAHIAADGIDVLVDLAGHTKLNSLPVFARRPAPVQITWLGYPDTTGLRSMDYRVTDAIADPAPSSDGLHTERLLRIEPPFVCYRPPPEAPAITSRGRDGPVVFGSFNMFSKVNEPLMALWSRILNAVPGSRLLVKSSLLEQPQTAARAREAFARHAIDGARLEIRPWTPGRADHLAGYNDVDIALDTYPYNGTTTTCEALWMGVPVVTLAGEMHMSRVGASLLSAAGLEEHVAGNADDYVRIAVALARDPQRREGLARDLRERLARSPLLDHAGFTRRLEAALRRVWADWCATPGQG